MGALAVRRLVDVVKSKSQAIVNTLVPVELVVRESTGAKGESRVADLFDD